MEGFLTSADKAMEMISALAFNALNSITVTKTSCKTLIDGLKFSPEEFDKRIQENLTKLERIRRRQADILQFINDRAEMIFSRADMLLNNVFRNLISQTSKHIKEWSGSIEELRDELQKNLKEKIMEANYEATKAMQKDVDALIGDVSKRFRDFKDDVQEYKIIISGTESKEAAELVRYSGNPENIVQDIAIQLGGAFGMGWLAGVVFMSAKKRRNALDDMEEKVVTQLEDQLNKAIPTINKSLHESINALKSYINGQLDMLIQSIENTIKNIKEERKADESKIKNTIAEYSAVYDKLNIIGDGIKEKYSSVN